jgi:hypothetical protein
VNQFYSDTRVKDTLLVQSSALQILKNLEKRIVTGGYAVNNYILEPAYRRFSDDIDFLVEEVPRNLIKIGKNEYKFEISKGSTSSNLRLFFVVLKKDEFEKILKRSHFTYLKTFLEYFRIESELKSWVLNKDEIFTQKLKLLKNVERGNEILKDLYDVGLLYDGWVPWLDKREASKIKSFLKIGLESNENFRKKVEWLIACKQLPEIWRKNISNLENALIADYDPLHLIFASLILNLSQKKCREYSKRILKEETTKTGKFTKEIIYKISISLSKEELEELTDEFLKDFNKGLERLVKVMK